jgi:hypothetical protein
MVAESPVVRHISRRERDRRKQFNLAIVLLVAVIVLALVLIWVVRRGAGEATASEGKPRRAEFEYGTKTVCSSAPRAIG